MLLVDRKKGNAVSPKAGNGLDGKCLAPYDAKTLARMGKYVMAYLNSGFYPLLGYDTLPISSEIIGLHG